MSQRRYNTVHDLAALRLHPDGTRVSASSSQNLRPRGAKHVVQDARGNWIASDAGGLDKVKKRRWSGKRGKKKDEESGAEESSADEDEGGDAGSALERRPLKSREAKKRRIFLGDFDFLDTAVRNAEPGPSTRKLTSAPEAATEFWAGDDEGTNLPSQLPIPSSDLLKAIHHFATDFYTERGQLIDAGREERRAKIRRRLARSLVASLASASGGVSPEPLDDDSDSYLRDGDEGESSSDRSSEDLEEMTSEQYAEYKSKADARRAEERQRPRDMYKAFDGSALMAIGMLVEAHITSMLQTQPPPDWVGPDEESEVEAPAIKGGKRRRRKFRHKSQPSDTAFCGTRRE